MKKKLSVTVEEHSISKIQDIVMRGTYRNKSHFVDVAINKLLNKENE